MLRPPQCSFLQPERAAVSLFALFRASALLLDLATVIPSNYFRQPFYEYTAEADRSIYCVMQMETKEALECVEGICAVPGLDSIVFGGMDWSGSLGFPHLPTWDLIEKEPQMLAAYDRVCAACKASGVTRSSRPVSIANNPL